MVQAGPAPWLSSSWIRGPETEPEAGGSLLLHVLVAVAADAVQRHLMALHHKAFGGDALHVARTAGHVEHAVAAHAAEMVVVGAAAEFVARGLAGQVHGLHFARFHQLLDVAVHRGQPDGRHLALRCAEDLGRKQGASSLFHDRAYRAALTGRAFHRDRKSTRLNSSHVRISYAVFCLKKKKQSTVIQRAWSD